MKKKFRRFATCARGYDIDAVESYIALESAKNDEAQLELHGRIKGMQKEQDGLIARINELENREERIKSALMLAEENAEKMTADIRARYGAELNRLKLFRAKWMDAYEGLKDRYHFEKDALNMEAVAVSCELELKNFLRQDFSLNVGESQDDMEDYFRSEVERLTSNGMSIQRDFSKDELVKKLKEMTQKSKENDTVAFSLEDALNPKESLEDICKSLGLKGSL